MKKWFRLCFLLLPALTWAEQPFGPGDKDSLRSAKTLDLNDIQLQDLPLSAHLDSLMVLHLFQSVAAEAVEPQTLITLDSVQRAAIQFSDSTYRVRMESLDQASPLDLKYNTTVRSFIDLYALRRRDQLSRMMGLAHYYFPLFEAKLDQHQLPLELKYLAVVESALNPAARSWVGATGLWQFMYSTGRMEGLKVSSYVDERNDPIKATEAACTYLKKLYNIFGDWNLALAAYNSGPGNVNKAIRRSGGQRDYWAIRPYLPRETAGYVPAFIAVNYIMNYAEQHLVYPQEIKPSFFSVDSVPIKEKITFDQIASLIHISKEELVFLNPAYRYQIIPKRNEDPYLLILPAEKAGLFAANEDSIYALAQADFQINSTEQPAEVKLNERLRHTVRRGEVLGTIAEQYGVGVSSIRHWNGLRGNTIRVGQRLTIYPRRLPQAQASAAETKSPAHPSKDGNYLTHKVRSGESFYSIARRYPGVSAENIMSWNKYSNARNLKPGDRIKIYPSS